MTDDPKNPDFSEKSLSGDPLTGNDDGNGTLVPLTDSSTGTMVPRKPRQGRIRQDPRSHLPTQHLSRSGAVDSVAPVLRVTTSPIPRLENPAHIYLDSLQTPSGARSRMYLLNGMARMCGASDYEHIHWEDMRTPEVRRLLAILRDRGNSPVTRNTYLSTIKATCREAWMMGSMDLEVLEKIRSIDPARHDKELAGTAYALSVLQALIEAARGDGTATAERNALIIAFIALMGLRRQEVTKIHLSDLVFSSKELQVHGKGNKKRTLELPAPLWDDLILYLDNERGYEPGALFCPYWNRRNKPKINDIGLEVSNVNSILNKARIRCEEYLPGGVTPHDLRRSFATELHRRDMSIREIQVLLGHANSSTTETYVRDDTDSYRSKAAKILSDEL